MSKHFEHLIVVAVLVGTALFVHFGRNAAATSKPVPAVEVSHPLPKAPVADELSPLPKLEQSAGHCDHLRQLDEHEAKIRLLSQARAVAAVA